MWTCWWCKRTIRVDESGILRTHWPPRPAKIKPHRVLKRDKILQAVKTPGVSRKWIAQCLGVSYVYVLTVMKDAGVTTLVCGRCRRKTLVADMRPSGMCRFCNPAKTRVQVNKHCAETGKCLDCASPALEGRQRCEKHHQMYKDYQREYRRRYRQDLPGAPTQPLETDL